MSASLPLYSLEHIQSIQEFIKSQGINNITSFSINKSFICFCTNFPSPFLYNIGTEKCFSINSKDCINSPISCVDISDDCKFIISGHNDGSLSYWSIDENKFLKNFKKVHNAKINKVSFGTASEYVFAGDDNGIFSVTSFKVRFSFFTVSQDVLYRGDSPSLDLKTIRGFPLMIGFGIFGNRYFVFDQYHAIRNEKSILNEGILEGIGKIDVLIKDGKLLVVIGGGKKLIMYQYSNPYAVNEIGSYRFDNETVLSVTFLSSSLIACVTTKGFVYLITADGRMNSSSQFNEFSGFLTGEITMSQFNDSIILSDGKNVSKVIFADWLTMIKALSAQSQFDEVYRILMEIHIGLGVDLIGLPTNKAICRIKVREVAIMVTLALLNKSLENPQTIKNMVGYAMAYANMLGISQMIIGDAYNIFAKAGLLAEFFQGVLSDSSPSPSFCTAEFVDQYFRFSMDTSTIKNAENMITNMNFEQSQAKMILNIARKYKLTSLQKRILIQYFDDYILPLQIYYEAGKLSKIVLEILDIKGMHPEWAKKKTICWLMVPIGNEYQRIQTLFNENWEKAAEITKKMLSLCPISFSLHEVISVIHVIDAVLRCVSKASYESISAILDIVGISIFENRLEYYGIAVSNVIKWVFESSTSTDIREYILGQIVNKYPSLIPPDILANVCQTCGFVGIAQKIYFQKKEYNQLIGSYLMSPSYRNTVFDFIQQHIDDREEIQIAVVTHFASLLQLDASRAAKLIQTHFQNLSESIIKFLSREQKHLYVSAQYLIHEDKSEFSTEFMMDLFESKCQFDRKNAIHFLKECFETERYTEDKALKICEKYQLIDCSIYIYQKLNRIEQAFSLLQTEIMNVLLEFTESETTVHVTSIDQLTDIKEFDRQIRPIQAAISLLNSIDKSQKIGRKWLDLFLCFQLPFYRCRNKKNEEMKNSLTFIFVFFTIEALAANNARTIFAALAIYFSILDPKQFRAILSYIFARLDYQTMLDTCVNNLLIQDCIRLNKKTTIKQNTGLMSQASPKCEVCHEILTKPAEEFKLFPCGHCFHENSKCGHHTSCILCSGSGGINSVVIESDNQKTPYAIIARKLTRFNFLNSRKQESENTETKMDGNLNSSAFIAPKMELCLTSDKFPFNFVPTCLDDSQLVVSLVDEKKP